MQTGGLRVLRKKNVFFVSFSRSLFPLQNHFYMYHMSPLSSPLVLLTRSQLTIFFSPFLSHLYLPSNFLFPYKSILSFPLSFHISLLPTYLQTVSSLTISFHCSLPIFSLPTFLLTVSLLSLSFHFSLPMSPLPPLSSFLTLSFLPFPPHFFLFPSVKFSWVASSEHSLLPLFAILLFFSVIRSLCVFLFGGISKYHILTAHFGSKQLRFTIDILAHSLVSLLFCLHRLLIHLLRSRALLRSFIGSLTHRVTPELELSLQIMSRY